MWEKKKDRKREDKEERKRCWEKARFKRQENSDNDAKER